MIRQLIDFYTKKEYRMDMLKAVSGVLFMWFCYVFKYGKIFQ